MAKAELPYRPMRMNAQELRQYVREQIRIFGLTDKAFAEKIGISAQYLSDFLSNKREPGKKLLDGLNLKRTVTYEWKESNK